jgi:PAS domain S-box-containing protein
LVLKGVADVADPIPGTDDAPLSVLMLEDSPLDADIVQATLAKTGLRTAVTSVDDEARFLVGLAAGPDLILSDYALPDYDGLRALEAAKRLAPDVPFIFVSGTMGEEIAIDALKDGATDYVLKQRLERLVPSVRRALTESRERAERRRAEAALRASEDRLRLALEAGRLGCWELDFETGVIECDGRFRANLGLPPDAPLTESSLIGLIHPNDRDRVSGAVARAVGGGADFDAEFRAVPPDRRVRWAAARGRVDKARRRLHGVALDLTERRAAEDALKLSEEQFRRALEDAPVPVIMHAEDGQVLQVSKTWEVLTGYAAADLPTVEDWLTRAYGDGGDRVRDAVRGLFAGDAGIAEVDFDIVTRAGDRRTWSFSASSPGVLRDGRRFVVGMALDVTDRRRAERAARESEERFRRIADSAPVLIWVTNPHGHVEYANRPFVGFAGVDTADWDGTGWTPLAHPDDRAEVADEYKTAHREARAFDRLVRLRAKGGAWRWMRAVGVPRPAPEGGFGGLVGSLTDVTEFKRTEDALRLADKRKDEFLATLAHELRNPLAPLRNAVQILKLAGDNPQHTEFAHGLVERQVAQLVRLVDDLLDVSRITRDKLTLLRKPTPLAEVVGMAVENSRSALDGAGHTLTVRLPADPVVLDVDPARLAQVLTNLLNNAAKYTPGGGAVTLTAAAFGDVVEIAVADSGIGLTEADRERIFEPFAQAGRVPGRAADGLGVGLALVRRLTELHGGTVAAESDGPGRGSTFVVRLPAGRTDGRRPPADPAPVAGRLKSPPARPPQPAPVKKVLVVDDVNDSGDSMGQVLRLLGLDVRVAHDGPAALAAAREFRPDVMLLDLGMPGMDGLEVARRMRDDPALAGTPLVAVTGHGTDADRERTRAVGFAAHLVKPVEIDHLRRVLAQVPVRPASVG